MRPFIIGSDQSSDFVINAPSVSGQHCSLEKLEDGTIAIKDNDSSNGTYINKRRIWRKAIQETDQITLGDHKVDGQKLFEAFGTYYQSHKTDFKEEYKEVLLLFKEFQDKKNKIIDKPKTALYARLAVGLGLVIVFVLSKDNISNIIYPIFIMSAAAITIISGLFNLSPVKKSEAMDKLILDYENKLVCPKCSSHMLNHGYAYWEGKTSCNNGKCNAILQ